MQQRVNFVGGVSCDFDVAFAVRVGGDAARTKSPDEEVAQRGARLAASSKHAITREHAIASRSGPRLPSRSVYHGAWQCYGNHRPLFYEACHASYIPSPFPPVGSSSSPSAGATAALHVRSPPSALGSQLRRCQSSDDHRRLPHIFNHHDSDDCAATSRHRTVRACVTVVMQLLNHPRPQRPLLAPASSPASAVHGFSALPRIVSDQCELSTVTRAGPPLVARRSRKSLRGLEARVEHPDHPLARE